MALPFSITERVAPGVVNNCNFSIEMVVQTNAYIKPNKEGRRGEGAVEKSC